MFDWNHKRNVENIIECSGHIPRWEWIMDNFRLVKDFKYLTGPIFFYANVGFFSFLVFMLYKELTK